MIGTFMLSSFHFRLVRLFADFSASSRVGGVSGGAHLCERRLAKIFRQSAAHIVSWIYEKRVKAWKKTDFPKFQNGIETYSNWGQRGIDSGRTVAVD
jgi:hypothetical protein